MKTVHDEVAPPFKRGDFVHHPDSKGRGVVIGTNMAGYIGVRWLRGDSYIKPGDLEPSEPPDEWNT